MTPRIILASASKQRQALMDALDLSYEIIPANIDEKAISDADLKVRAEKIARSKAETVGSREEGIIIAADTFLNFNGEVMEKPGDLDEARDMLSRLSGNKALVHTGFCYIDKSSSIDFSGCVTNEVEFRDLVPEEINAYVEKFPVITWAGAVSPAYTYGLTLFKNVTNSPSSFTHGLPMNLLIPLLQKSGISVLPSKIKD